MPNIGGEQLLKLLKITSLCLKDSFVIANRVSFMYFSIDDILAEETPILSTFKSEVDVSFFFFAASFFQNPENPQDLGFLDNGNKQQGLPAGSKVSLPLWLSTALFMENAIDVELPPVYGKNSCSQINADPKVVALGPHPHWYEVGAKVTKLASTLAERDRICKTLMLAFSQVRNCLFDICKTSDLFLRFLSSSVMLTFFGTLRIGGNRCVFFCLYCSASLIFLTGYD